MLEGKALELAQGNNLAILSTKMADGTIQTHPLWVDTDGENLIVNTETHRPKFKNMERDADVTVLLQDDGNAWNWAEVRGKVTGWVIGDEAKAHIDKLSFQYLGKEEYPNPVQSERVMVTIKPERVVNFPPGS